MRNNDVTSSVPAFYIPKTYPAGMPTHSKTRKTSAKATKSALIFPREWRKHFNVSAETVAERMGIERESVLRMERETWRMSPDKQAAYASALDTLPENFWRKPRENDVQIRQSLEISAEYIDAKNVTK